MIVGLSGRYQHHRPIHPGSPFKIPLQVSQITHMPHSEPRTTTLVTIWHFLFCYVAQSGLVIWSLWRAFKSPMGFIHTKQRGRPKAVPHSLLTILNHIRPLKPLKWLSRAVLMTQHDQSILCNFLSIKQKRNCHMGLNNHKYSTSVKRARAIPFAISKRLLKFFQKLLA